MGAQRKTAEPTVVNGINVDDLFALIDERQARTCKRQDELARHHDLAGPGAEPRGNREL